MGHYLGELYRLGGQRALVAPSALAEVVGVTPPAVARMVRRLQAAGLVRRRPYKGVELTRAGEKEALRTIRYHRLSEAFLVTVMGYGWHEAHDLADALAEIADPTLVARMDEKAGHPKRCPHGEPIPTAEGVMPEIHDLPVTELEVGAEGAVSRVQVRDEDRLVYLADNGLTPGTPVRIEAKAPFQGPIRLRARSRAVVLGFDLASHIRIEPQVP